MILDCGNAWTRAEFARGVDGFSVEHDDPAAVAWCLLGALRKATDEADLAPEESAALVGDLGACCCEFDSDIADVVGFNDKDGRAFADIAAVLARFMVGGAA